MGDIVALLNSLNLSPINTLLLVVLGFFVQRAVKGIFSRISKVEERDRRQDIALARIEERLGMAPINYADDRQEQ